MIQVETSILWQNLDGWIIGQFNSNNDFISKFSCTNKYHIYIVGKQINGFNWLSGGFGLGNISSHTEEIEVCEKEHSLDYQIVSEWIHKNMWIYKKVYIFRTCL